MLIENLKKFITELKDKRNIIVTNIVADVLSDGGKKIVEKMGMKYVHNSKHDSEIYEYSIENKWFWLYDINKWKSPFQN